MALMSALSSRQSLREFAPEPLHEQVLSDLLWAAGGINRRDVDGRTAPSAMNAQEVLLYVAMPQGLFLYEPKPHALRLVLASDVRRVTGNQTPPACSHAMPRPSSASGSPWTSAPPARSRVGRSAA
jgi:hypothetical protein